MLTKINKKINRIAGLLFLGACTSSIAPVPVNPYTGGEFASMQPVELGKIVAAREITKNFASLIAVYGVGCVATCAATHFLGIQLGTLEVVGWIAIALSLALVVYTNIMIKKGNVDHKRLVRTTHSVAFLFSIDTAFLLVQLSVFSILLSIGVTTLILCASYFIAQHQIFERNLSSAVKVSGLALSYVVVFGLFTMAAKAIEHFFGYSLLALFGPLSHWLIMGGVMLALLVLSTIGLMVYLNRARNLCEKFGAAMQQGGSGMTVELETEALNCAFNIFVRLVDLFNLILQKQNAK